MAKIGDLTRTVAVLGRKTTGLGEFVDDEDPVVTQSRQNNQREVEKAMRMIDHLNKLHDEATKRRTNPSQRIIGFVLHAEPIVVYEEPNDLSFTRDWAFIQLYNEKTAWATFQGEKVYIAYTVGPSVL